MTIVYVYGTLRTGHPSADLHSIPGSLFDLGWFPGYRPEGDGTVTVERVQCDIPIENFDSYEGYHPRHESGSLYLRKPLKDGWIYVYNQDFGRLSSSQTAIPSGDWINYIRDTNKAGNYGRFHLEKYVAPVVEPLKEKETT